MILQKRHNQIIGSMLLGICVFLTAISVYLCFSRDIWYDELFTVGLAELSLPDLLSVAAGDVHPPLYYLIVKLVLDTGKLLAGNPDPVILAKIVSVFPFVLLLVYGVTKVRKHFGILTAGIFCFLAYTMPQISQYTVEIRMYGYCLFFITAGMLHAYEIVRAEKGQGRLWDWIVLTVYLLAAAYSHYFAFVAAAMIYLYLLLWLVDIYFNKGDRKLPTKIPMETLSYKEFRKIRTTWQISAGVAMIAYLPWLVSMMGQLGKVKENYWILPLTWRSIGGCIKFLFKPAFTNDSFNTITAVILFVLFVTSIILLMLKNRKRDSSESFFLIACLGVMAGLVLFGFIASFLFRPIFIYRYMLPAIGLFWLSFAVASGRLIEKNKFFYIILVLFLIAGIRNYRAFYGEEMWKRVQMQETMKVLADIEKEDILIFNFNHTQGVVSYYLSDYLTNKTFLYNDSPEELVMKMFPTVSGMGTEQEIRNWLAEGKTVWFLGSGNAREDLRAEWSEAGLFTEETASCLIERYWFDLYRIQIVRSDT